MTPDERTAWLAERKTGIGGSDIAAILGISPFKTSFGLWLEKTSRNEDEIKDDERLAWGRRLETAILDEWTERHGIALDRGVCVRHPEHAIVRATLDGSCLEQGIVVEAKNVDTTPAIPQPYYATQVLWEMLASGATTGYLTELVRGHEIAEFVFHRDAEQARMAELLRAGLEWWDTYVVHDVPPDPLAADVGLMHKLFPVAEAQSSVDLPDELVEQYLNAKGDEEAAALTKDTAKVKMQMLMGAAKHGRSGLGKVSWYSVTGRESIDLAELKKQHPAAKSLIKKGSDYRVFKLT